MLLYVDETENDEVFIVAGLLVENELSVQNAYKHFKKRIKNYPIKGWSKEFVYREFKSTILDKHYQKIKKTMIEEIQKIKNYRIIYAEHRKQHVNLTQKEKEQIYISLIIRIVEKCGSVYVVFDEFSNNKFESKIETELKKLDNVEMVAAKDSQEVPGLQFVDNLCSVIRLNNSRNDRNEYFKILEMKVIKV